MEAHAAFFGPVKYSILPDILPQEDILNGNGYVEAGTFLAIMLGTLSGALMLHLKVPALFLSTQLLAIALLGLYASWRIQSNPWHLILKFVCHGSRKSVIYLVIPAKIIMFFGPLFVFPGFGLLARFFCPNFLPLPEM